MSAVASLTKAPQQRSLPPLEIGEMLALTEFLRRYEDMPGVKQAELIERIVQMPSPVRVTHAEPDEHEHLLRGRILRLVQDDEGTLQFATSHVS